MRPFAAVTRLWLIALMAIQPAAAAVRYFDISGATAAAENACPIWVLQGNKDDCSYNKSNPYGVGTAQWIGPVFSAGYYAVGAAPLVFSNTAPPAPVIAPAADLPLGGKTGIAITHGFISIDDKGTPDPADDVIGGTIEFDPFARNVATGLTTRVVETFEHIIHRINVPAAGASNVSSATTPNAGGGVDYVIGKSGGASAFPVTLTGSTTADGGFTDPFPSEIGSQSTSNAADTRYWPTSAANGIARYEGTSAITGSATTATVWGYTCDAGPSLGSCVTTNVNWDTDDRASLDNVLLQLSTDNSGNITSASAFLVNEFRVTDGSGVNDSWAATTLTFTGIEDGHPDAFDDRASLTTGGLNPDPDVTVNALLNDVPGVAPVHVSIVSQGTLGTAEVLTTPASAVNAILYRPSSAGLPGGNDSVTYRITDANNDTADGTLAIVLVNDVPVAVDDDVTAENGAINNIRVQNNDTSLSDAPITIAITSGPSHGTALVVPAAAGRAALVRYASASGFVGTDSFHYHLTDSNGDVSNDATVTITVSDSTPVAVNDTAAVEDGVTATIRVLQNDTGLVDQPFVIKITSPPVHGTATVVPGANGALPFVTYTSTAGFAGADAFSYTVTDADGDVSASAATVAITVTDTVPVAVSDTFGIDSRAPVNMNVLTNDQGLTDQPITIEIVQQPTLGTARVIASSSSANGFPVIEYTSAAGSAGTDTLKYRLRDSDGDVSATNATVTITVTNTTPAAVNDPMRTIENNTASILDVLANDTGTGNRPLTITITGQPVHGHATVIAGSGTSNPTVKYTPATGYEGADSLRYSFSDADGDMSPTDALVPLTISDSVPVANDDNQNGDSREPRSFDVLLNDTGIVDLPVSVQITQQPAHGTAAVVAIPRSNGTTWPGISYASDKNSSGDDTVKYTITDSDGDVSNVGTLTLTVTNATPMAVNDAGGDPGLLPSGYDVVIEQMKTPVDVLVNDTGRGNRPLTLTITQSPSHGTATVESAEATGSGRPRVSYQGNAGYTGPDGFSYTFADGDAQVSNEATVTFEVVSIPVATDDGQPLPLATTKDKAITVDVLANDGGLAYGPIQVGILSALNGTAIVNADNTVTFTPDPGFTGAAPGPNCPSFSCEGGSFTYSITDAFNQKAEGSAYIDVLPPPVTDSGGSSAVDVEFLALLAAGGAWRRRFRSRQWTTR